MSEPVVIDRRPKLAEQLPERLRVLAGERVERALARLVRKQRALGGNGVDLLRLLRELLRNAAAADHEKRGGEEEGATHVTVFLLFGEEACTHGMGVLMSFWTSAGLSARP